MRLCAAAYNTAKIGFISIFCNFFSPAAAIFAQGTVGKKRRIAACRVTFCDYMQKIRIFARRKFERDKQ